ncbi:ion transporter [Chloroflexi bacterium TSY]|nr:ion transporter [Chloroflexi bacterium TSY]
MDELTIPSRDSSSTSKIAETSEPVTSSGWLTSDRVVLSVVMVNAAAILLLSYPLVQVFAYNAALAVVDYICSLFFVVEAIVKIRQVGFRQYWRDHWNKLDFLVVLTTIPLLVNPFIPANLEIFSFISLLRMGRFLRFIRSLRMIRYVSMLKNVSNGIAVLQAPIFALFILVGLYLVIDLLNLPIWIVEWNNKGLYFLLALNVTWGLSNLFGFVYRDYLMPWAEQSPSDVDDLLMPLGKIFIEFFIWAVGLMVAVNSAGYDASAILASLGIGGLAFAFAA